MAREAGGEFFLRMEDIDRGRCRPEWEDLIVEDLTWLGLTWDGPILRQSERIDLYRDALKELAGLGLLFECVCKRKDILEAALAPHEGEPLMGPDGIVYPGTCRSRKATLVSMNDFRNALRLNMKEATASLGESASLRFCELGRGPRGENGGIEISEEFLIRNVGDVVLARRDIGTSYHLSVVVDDADQEISHVVRGQDLFDATSIHVLLQNVLGLHTPMYYHHRLIRDDEGKRLAKRTDALALRKLREDGVTPAEVRSMVGL